MHTVWKGSISFGLVNIPVKLFSAVEDKDIKFRQLHKECLTPIRYKKVAENCGDEEVKPDDIIKVYETPQGKYIQITDEEINKLKEEFELKQVSIIDFVNLAEIDPIYYDKTYYVGAESNGTKPYSLLSEILKRTEKIGIAKVTIRSNERLAAIRPHNDMLIMETLHFPDEVRDAGSVPYASHIDKSAVSEKELQVGMMLVDQLTTKFEPEKYTDTYRTALENLIQEKIERNLFVDTPEKDVKKDTSNVYDLMTALQASIEKTKTDTAPPKTRKPRKKTS
ncbi:MAG: Ku protein [Bacillales bacterium]|jgi:DNA end-binding protein Ku|nr:Ku protein [Bacillales bacterium]